MHQARIENEPASTDRAYIDAAARRAVAIPPHRLLGRLELLRFGIDSQGPAVVFWVPVLVEIQYARVAGNNTSKDCKQHKIVSAVVGSRSMCASKNVRSKVSPDPIILPCKLIR